MSVASAVYERTCHVCDAIRLYFQSIFNYSNAKRQTVKCESKNYERNVDGI